MAEVMNDPGSFSHEVDFILYNGADDSIYISDGDVRRACTNVFRKLKKIKITMPEVEYPIMSRQEDELEIIFSVLASNKSIRVVTISNLYFRYPEEEYESWEKQIMTANNKIEQLIIEYKELDWDDAANVGAATTHMCTRLCYRSDLDHSLLSTTASRQCNKKRRGNLKSDNSSSDDENDTLMDLVQKKQQMSLMEKNYDQMLVANKRLEIENERLQVLSENTTMELNGAQEFYAEVCAETLAMASAECADELNRLVEKIDRLRDENGRMTLRIGVLKDQLEKRFTLERTVEQVTRDKEALETSARLEKEALERTIHQVTGKTNLWKEN